MLKKNKNVSKSCHKKTKMYYTRADIKKPQIFQQQKMQCQEYIKQAILKIDFKHDIICGRF